MSYALDFAPDAYSQWRELVLDRQRPLVIVTGVIHLPRPPRGAGP